MKTFARYFYCAGLLAAGFAHFILDDGFAEMLPDFVPYRYGLIYLTGVIEFAVVIGLLFPSLRRVTGILTAIYLVAIFPANIYSAIYDIPAPGMEETNQALLYIRLLFQPLLIWWVLKISK